MQYDFELVSSTSAECADYQSAFHCAVSAVESIFYDLPFTVVASIPVISVIPNDVCKDSMSFPEIKGLAQGAFVDSDGVLYPQFKVVKPRSSL